MNPSPKKGTLSKLTRDSLHAVLLRYGDLLRKFLHSGPGQVLFHPSGPLAPLVARVRGRFAAQDKVLRLPALLKLGFSERAVSEMEKVAAESPSAVERLGVCWELAVHFMNRAGTEKLGEASAYLDFVLGREKSKARLERAEVLKSECLDRLGRREEAIRFTRAALKRRKSEDLALALSNLYAGDGPDSTGERLALINQVMARHGLEEITLLDPDAPLELKNICSRRREAGIGPGDPLVSVIMPAYNAEEVLSTALGSLLAQSWRNLEIIVVDDASTDGTADVARRFSRKDERVRLITCTENRGPYVARNLGLREAGGEFVTCHDTDDWSHPAKIELQARHLMENPGLAANVSQLARVLPGMVFHRRGNPGFYVAKNMSSLMFRRRQVIERAGWWDGVRFAGDSEFLARLRRVFGDRAVADLSTGPVAFAGQEDASLTGDRRFGYYGFFMGARSAYRELHKRWHEKSGAPYMDFPLESRPFPAPYPMSSPAGKRGLPRTMDVVIATEIRLTGGTIASTIEEIKAQQAAGLTTGLMPLSRFDLHPDRPWNPKILDLVDNRSVHLLVYGERVRCRLLVIRHPPVLQHHQDYLPEIEAENIVVVANQAPFRDYQDPASRLYDLASCSNNLRRYFGCTGTWHPIGPAVRQALLKELSGEEKIIALSDADWTNIIEVESPPAKKNRPGNNPRPVIGRHSRDQYVKWPSDREELLAAYPADDAFEVKILGGAAAAQGVVGRIPDNWTVYPFDALSPREFLAQIDVFVYFTHPGWVEAFGRTPLEAMAAGVPVILPEVFKPLFREAAVYAAPFEVRSIVMRLCRDVDFYDRQVGIALDYVRKHFSHQAHLKRLDKYLSPVRSAH
jgi:glycosyltransferase involved in cell wall biosynthesis